MHKEYKYTSVFSALLNDYVASRRGAGYMFDNPAYWLSRFDRFCVEQGVEEPILTKPLYAAWSYKQDTEGKVTQRNRLSALKGFSLYLSSLGLNSYLPLSLPRAEKTIPYLMEDADIQSFFHAVDKYVPIRACSAFQRMAVEYKVLFRLIVCCGLRISEACNLKLEQTDFESGVITVLHAKRNTNRVVYLAEDLRALCFEYRNWLLKQTAGNTHWLFPGMDAGQHIPRTSLDRKFRELWNTTERANTCDKKPTVHCLRHAFVMKRMNLWMEQDRDFCVLMPYLSRYLGHRNPVETHYYYHQTKEVFQTLRRKDKVSAIVIPEVSDEKSNNE